MDIVILLMLGGILLYKTTGLLFVSFKPAVSFEQMLDGKEVKAGSHIAGDVVYAMDYFASQNTYTRYSDGSRSGNRNSGNYYLIPVSNGYIGLKSRQSDVEALDTLSNETFEYLESGTEPTTTIFMEGSLSLMEENIAKYYREYLGEMGYTEADIDEMGDPLLFEYVNFNAARIMFAIGIVLIALALFLFWRRYKRECRESGLIN